MECKDKFGAKGCVYESGELIANILLYQPDFRETPAPQKLGRRYCYMLNEGSDTCYVRDNSNSTEQPSIPDSTEQSPIVDSTEQSPFNSKDRRSIDWWSK